MSKPEPSAPPWRHLLHEIIFEARTPAGKAFDVSLLILILLSLVIVSLESVASIRASHGYLLRWLEWIITILFTVEYVVRLISVNRPLRYAKSFFGVVDLLAILPTYLSLFFAGTQALIAIRALRLLRVFRILKLAHYLAEASILWTALKASHRKITVFLGTVVTLVMIVGAVMYLIEGADSGFTSIPQSVYWAVVTMTTVGYGDIAPQTVPGKFLASLVMILGYGIIAVPTGVVTAEIAQVLRESAAEVACLDCGKQGHRTDSTFCRFCGGKL